MLPEEIAVLRYGHRLVRDYRVTSHCCLVARAFGAKEITISGDEDKSLKESVSDITARWGGPFQASFTESWRRTLSEYKKKGFFAVHLTMYGQPLQKEIKKIRKKKKVLIVIGSQKVEKEVYEQCHANIAVTGQPHSEIAALAVTLDWLQNGKELEKKFKKAKIEIVPQKKGKKVKKQASV
jgi:tRNA (cytidine56-2'-O)-methyltransferase